MTTKITAELLASKDINPIPEHKLEELFDDFLDEVYGMVKIGPYEYSTSHAMKDVDPTAYRQEYLNWLDHEISEGRFSDEIDGEHYDGEEVQDLIDSVDEE